MDREHYDLADRFAADAGTVFLSGVQALARIPIEQLRVDRRDGLNTAAFVSGYPGSPLGGFDTTMRRGGPPRPRPPDRVPPRGERGVRRDRGDGLPARRGAARLPLRRHRRHLVRQGARRRPRDRRPPPRGVRGHVPHGGAVAFVGDDPGAKSSTLPSSSAGVLGDLHMPMLYPGDPAEVLDLGRHAIALSRLSGLWTAIKIVADVADGTASVELDPDRARPVLPDVTGIGTPRPPDGHLLTPLTPRPRARDLRGALRARRRVRGGEPPQPRHRRRTRRVDRHRRVGHHLPRGARGVPAARAPRRGRDRGARHPAAQDAHADAVRPRHGPRVRPRARRGLRDRGEAAQPRAAREGRALRHARPPAGRRQGRRGRARSDPRLRRARRRRARPRAAAPPRAASPTASPRSRRPHASISVTVGRARTPFYCSGCPHNRSPPRCPTVRSSAPASAATR